ncbi:TAF5-like RNA polymerase II p300/CBP-associated factor-associated factor 65 kDa subunit 5L isoform X2 [Watersipora subatra]|uniref:TAF5-like RNA polymerase II p300/CBP-associated factor-associated factor 65 kDa subunit 5L isoform X2 n=1 Tax=Watersipora subatra TaxID=2589382 RepID=UPI00355B0CB5
MKRVNKEHIAEVLEAYFDKRNFTVSSTASAVKPVDLATSAVQMAASLETSLIGSINCASVTNGDSGTEAEVQFSRLVLFVKAASEKHKSALMNTLFPIFISIYVDMLVGGLKQIAHRFHQMNRPIFNNLPIYKSTMDAIMMVVQKCDKDTGSCLSKMLHSELGESKFNVKFPSATLRYLTNYLKSRENMMILQVFNSNITVEIDSEDNVLDTLSPTTDTARETKHDLNGLQAAIDAVNGVVSPLSEVQLHLIDSQHPKVICGCVTESHLVLGCDDSSLRLLHKHDELLTCSRPTDADLSHTLNRPADSKHLVDVSKVRWKDDWLEDSVEGSLRNGHYDPRSCRAMRGHSSEVFSLAAFDDSTYLISSSADKTIRLWDTESCTNRVLFEGHLQTVWSLATARNSSYFASCSKDRSAKLWSTEYTFPLRTYVGHISSVDCVKFHPNNSYLATAGQDRTVRLWDRESGKCVRLMQGHRGIILSLAFSPTGTILASAGEDRRIRLWDLASGELVKEMKGHTDTIRCLHFNTDGSLLFSGAQDNTLIAWNTKISRENQSFTVSSSLTANDLLASYHTQHSNCSFVSIQSPTGGTMEVIGVLG